MELWGKWYAADIWQQLRSGERPRLLGRGATQRAPNGGSLQQQGGSSPNGGRGLGYDGRLWLRLCGVACITAECAKRRVKVSGPEAQLLLQPCARWLLDTEWGESMVLDFFSRAPRRGGLIKETGQPQENAARRLLRERQAERLELIALRLRARNVSHHLPGTAVGPSSLDGWTSVLRDALIEIAGTPPSIVQATALVGTTHPQGYVAFRYPLHAIDRREYQLYVHILHSAAALTGRVPVLPLAYCRSATHISTVAACRRRCLSPSLLAVVAARRRRSPPHDHAPPPSLPATAVKLASGPSTRAASS